MLLNILANKIPLYLLQISFLFIPLYFNKNVLRFRINQQAALYFFVILILFFFCLKTLLANGKTFSLSHFFRESHHKMMLLFILLMIVSLLISPYKWLSLQDLLLFLSYFLIYFLVIELVKDDRQIFRINHTMFLSAFMVAIYTIIQYYGWDPFIPEIPKLTSTIGQRNWISNFLFMPMPIAFFYYLLEKNSKQKIYYYIFLSLLYINLLILQSRGIWIAIAVAGLFGLVFLSKLKLGVIFLVNKKWLLLLVVTFVVISVIYSTENIFNKSPLFIEQRILPALEGEDVSLNKRILILYVAYDMFRENPILGIGLGMFKKEYLSYQAKVLPELPARIASYYANAQEAHNEYFQILAELGIIGLLIFLSIIYFFYRKILRSLLKENISSEQKSILFGFLIGITGFLVHGLFTFPFHVPVLGMTFAGLSGLTIAFCNHMERSERSNLESNTNNQERCIKNANLYFTKGIKGLLAIILVPLSFYLLNFLVIKPYYAELLYFRGLRHTVDSNYEMALENFERAYQLNPYDGKNLHALGGTYYTLHNYEKAEYFLTQAKHYITEVNTFYNLGLVYRQAGLLSQAEEEFKYALYLMPEFTKAYYELGYLYFIQERYIETIENWQKILEIEPDFANRYILFHNLGIAYQKKGMTDRALEYFLKALSLVPEGHPLQKEIEEEIGNIYRNKLEL